MAPPAVRTKTVIFGVDSLLRVITHTLCVGYVFGSGFVINFFVTFKS